MQSVQAPEVRAAGSFLVVQGEKRSTSRHSAGRHDEAYRRSERNFWPACDDWSVHMVTPARESSLTSASYSREASAVGTLREISTYDSPVGICDTSTTYGLPFAP